MYEGVYGKNPKVENTWSPNKDVKPIQLGPWPCEPGLSSVSEECCPFLKCRELRPPVIATCRRAAKVSRLSAERKKQIEPPWCNSPLTLSYFYRKLFIFEVRLGI